MNDLFGTTPAGDEAPDETAELIRNGKAYSLRMVMIDKAPRWGIRWRALDGSSGGVVSGWYDSPGLAHAAIEMVADQ